MPLKDNDPRKWEYKEHTRVKHIILKKYLKAWINILGKNRKVCYFDCFAGRGKYSDGTEGSPLIALKAAADLINNRSHLKEVELTFIEKDKNNYGNLLNVLEEELKNHPDMYLGVKLNKPINDEFINAVPLLLKDYKKLPPSFFFIDPFGFNGIPIKVLQDILLIPKTEVFINFMIRDVNRFLNSPNHLHSIEGLYGLDDLNGTIISKYPYLDKESALLELYQQQLHEHTGVNYTFPFKVSEDEKKQTTYYLIHATNHPLGCEIMKEIMYKAGTRGRFGYLGPEEGQILLSSYDLKELKEYLIYKFSNQSVLFEEVMNKTVDKTPFIKKEYKEALIELENEGKILIWGKGAK
ncbi:three-Cys-motif partner protein TcmP [Methanosarcina mazei]|nr:three-Cys-motif partner protein TcmP [Methanosarcina mazei]KKG04760.1 hypothetical protein DU40_20130 [Methanosarcina mazei]KKH69944.1 hypothetical protein DU87_19280 [Methanosarcina mazei]